MKRIVTFIFYILSINAFAQNFPTKSFVYGGLELSSPQKIERKQEYFTNYIDPKYRIQNADYALRSPAMNVGYVGRNGVFFFNTAIGYWYGEKKFNYENYFETDNPAGNRYANATYYKAGDIYYAITEFAAGKAKLHNVDFNLTGGFNLSKILSVNVGYRRNMIIGEEYKGSLYQSILKLQYQGGSSHTLASSNEAYHNNDIKSHHGQELNGLSYVSFGICANLPVLERESFIQMDYTWPLKNNNNYTRISYLNIKLGLAFFKSKKGNVLEKEPTTLNSN